MGKKKDTNILPILAVGGALLLMGGSKKKNTVIVVQQPVTDNVPAADPGLLEDLKDNQFETNNGITSPTSSDIIPYIVPASFVVKKISNKYYYFDHPDSQNYDYQVKQYATVARISFLICIQVPPTSSGSLKIEDVFFEDIQIVRYINDQKQKWYKLNDPQQLKKLGEQFKGQEAYTGNNLFEISFDFIPDLTDDELNFANYSFEAVSVGMNIKYEETRLAHWRMLSAWNIMEDTRINEGVALGTNTRFGIVRNADSKPRDERGLFSEWWNYYVQSGYDTTIRKISASATDYYLGNKF